ncbi:Hypothetical Protein SLY_0902 [Strawberry lethal yellows phytoplasma (CPA) str. NZSb11]|uniref:Uncharacterized protein n=1 Tax=Strawberry lethal yellows phytoplasma (CPA) str. NZSb11 TaxID=980422 RepID=R4RY21_PHYAS|nr:Hypothetical Protein SLY_0902 [Strawberry lethal yellows phytoplasma (CPA) str. NZSb11]
MLKLKEFFIKQAKRPLLKKFIFHKITLFFCNVFCF